MALTQSDLEALDTAIAASELEVQLDGRRVKYRSIDELLKARAHVAGVLAASANTGGRRRAYRFTPTTYRGD